MPKESTTPTAAAFDPSQPREPDKLKALNTVLEALVPLERPARLDVLRSAASYYGVVLGTEIGR